MPSAASADPTGAHARVPAHLAWVATGSAQWAATTGAATAQLAAAEDQALRALVESALDAGVRWLTVQEPTGGRGLEAATDALASRNVRIAPLSDAAACREQDAALTVLLTTGGCGRSAIVEAVARLAEDGVRLHEVDEKAIAARLDAPDVDLLVQTGGDWRVHDLLLWEVAYSELVVLEAPWPAVGRDQVAEALSEYAQRDRRYGGIVAHGSRE